jgi:alpha-L-fucosidase
VTLKWRFRKLKRHFRKSKQSFIFLYLCNPIFNDRDMKQKRTFIITILCIAAINVTQAQKDYDFYHQKYPSWFADAKLGIFIHYGLYCVPSWSGAEQYAEWFYKGLIGGDTARQEFMRKVYGDDFKYEDFKSLFRAEMFNADQWATLFKKSGARYVIFTSKHHDGFCLWDDSLSGTWNTLCSPAKMDFCQELSEAVRQQGLKFGLYYSLLEWNNPFFRWTIDTTGLEHYVNDYMLPQFKSLIWKFKPDLLFADGDWDFTPSQLRSEDLVQYYYDVIGGEGIVNNRWGSGFDYGYLTPEYSSGIKELKRPWAECRGLSRSFGLNRNADLSSYMTSEELILHFVSLVAAGGGLTLNVSPSADGQIPLLQQERLLDWGEWLATNGEAIYGAKPYKVEGCHDYRMRTDSISDSINFNWVRNAPMKGMPEDNFDIDFWTEITPEYSEEYTFYLQADDTATLYIDTMLVPNTTTIKLKKGRTYLLYVSYSEKDLNSSVSLQWESRHTPKETIKAHWNTRYYYDMPYKLFTQKGDDVYVIVNKELLPVFYESKTQGIDYELKPLDVKSKGAVVFKLEGYLKD